MSVPRTNITHHAFPGKARFDEIYDRPDPRPYFQTLAPLEYQIPHHAQQIFRMLLANHGKRCRQGAGRIVDLCCSYGINAALLNHDLTLRDLYSRYTSPELTELSSAELVAVDREFFQQRRLHSGVVSSVGIDAAVNAVSYARGAGLLDTAFPENLETTAPSPALRSVLTGVTLITVTGGVGYIGARTFQHLLKCMYAPAWVAAFVLRTVRYDPIAEALARFNLVTEKLHARTFLQRRFSNAAEQRHALDALARAGLDPAGKEATGYYHAELYLSRPARDVAELPLEALLTFPPGYDGQLDDIF